MAINGAHVLLYSTDADATRAALRDLLGGDHVDAGGGWLIFALPPGEIGVHPNEGPTFSSGVRHQLSLMCDDVHGTLAELRAKGFDVDDEVSDEGYGLVTTIHLPGDVDVDLYQPRHPTAI